MAGGDADTVTKERVVVMTDPARELAELCERLHNAGDTRSGEAYLSAAFEVQAWSKDFYQIVFAILDRIELVKALIAGIDLDADHKTEALAHAEALAGAFGSTSLQSHWHNNGSTHLARVNVQPIKMLSAMIRQRLSYPKLSSEDVEELKREVSELLAWLTEHQLAEQDFVRQALVDGLEQFHFRLSRLQWLGYGYTIESLRDVISAYMALDRGLRDPAEQPDAAAVMQKTATVIRAIYDRIAVAKNIVEVGDFMLRAYGATSLAMKAYPGVAGLLPSG